MNTTPSAPRWLTPEAAYSRQPFKALYFAWIFLPLPLLIATWTVQFFLNLHPHPPSYTLYESLRSRWVSRSVLLVSQTATFAGVLHFGDGPGELTPEGFNAAGKLKRTRAQWIPLPGNLDKWFKGHAVKEGCEPSKIAAMTWGKRGPPREDLAVGPNETVFLHLHGGGFTTGNATENYVVNNLARIVSACDAIDHVVTPEFRQLDQGPWPLPLVDCITSYAYLVDTLKVCPSRILIGGDSAGGCLALALLRYLRDDVKVAKLPRAALLVSPLADVSGSIGPKLHLHRSPNRDADILNLEKWSPFITACLLRDNPLSLLDSPYLSPAASTVLPTPSLFAGLSPALVVAGGIEHFVADVRELVRRMRQGGVECEYIEKAEAPHDFVLLDWFGEAKRKGARERIQAWVGEHFA